MTPTKLLIGQILIVFAIVFFGVWAAAMLAYQPELDRPVIIVGGLPLYRPWALFAWWYHYGAYPEPIFDKAGMLAGASGFVGCGAAIFGSLWRARQANNVTTYGSARAGQHIARSTPPGCMAIPASCSAASATAISAMLVPSMSCRSRRPGRARASALSCRHCLAGPDRPSSTTSRLFNPTDPRSARYNPLLEVRRGANEVRDVQNIADILLDPVITTDRRSYHLALVSTTGAAMAGLSWSYPQDALIALKNAQSQAAAAAPVASGIDFDRLRFNYAISATARHGDRFVRSTMDVRPSSSFRQR